MWALQCPQQSAGCRRSGRSKVRSGAETRPSKQHKLARVRAAARASRRDYRVQEGGRNSLHPWDFEAREPRRANAKSPMAERRTSVNRSPCGRRTSLRDGARRFFGCVRATLPTVYPDKGSDAIAFHSMRAQWILGKGNYSFSMLVLAPPVLAHQLTRSRSFPRRLSCLVRRTHLSSARPSHRLWDRTAERRRSKEN
jgi:hypothetical protein